MARTAKVSSIPNVVHERIRTDILNGRWVPGEKLQPAVVAADYDTSTTVIREALTRLVGEKFVVLEPNRGFFVPHLSLDELRDLTEVRCRAEGLAIELALDRGDIAWESRLIAAHHGLARTPRRHEEDPLSVADAWADAHRLFHRTLLEACEVPVLMELSRQLSYSTELYRRWAATSVAGKARNIEKEHERILEAALSRDAELTSRLIRTHYETTAGVILKSGLLDGVDSTES